MGGRGNVVPPASHPLPGGPPVGGGVLQAAVSARDQILGLAEGSETAQSLCGRQTSGGSADCRLVHRRRRQTKYILRITSFITNVENRVMRFFSFFYSSDITIKDISIYKFAIVFVTLRRSFQNYSHANLIIQLKLKPTQIYLSTLFHIY